MAVDARTSSDPEAGALTYAWDFGDGATGTGVTASHTYASAGTYTVGLTVTDNGGLTDTITHDVTVTAPGTPAVLAQDAFTRSVAAGWGDADVGGTWNVSNLSRHSVDGSRALATYSPGWTLSSWLDGPWADSDMAVTMSTDVMPTGGGVYARIQARRISASEYSGARVS